MVGNDPLDSYDDEGLFDDEYFDGDELDDDLLYSLFDEDEYEPLDEDDE